MSAQPGIVTPEAVVLEFETSALPSRMMATFLDGLIQLALVFVLIMVAAGLSAANLEFGGLVAAGFYVVLFLILFAYPAAFETLWRGRTPGKAAVGLRVVTVEGAPIRFRHAAIRAILGIVDKILLAGTIGVVALLVTRRNQRLGDLVAGTIVLRERSGAGAPRAVQFHAPRGLEPFVASLDVSGLDHDDYAAVRSFLLRAATLTPAARHALATQLATSMLERLRATPPPGLPAELFLASVAAAYQRREGRTSAGGRPFSSVWAGAATSGGPSGGGPAPRQWEQPPVRTETAAEGYVAPG